jgi:heterodisulfide reductase subunit C
MCDAALDSEADIPLASLIQLILMNDEEVLTSRTVWSNQVLENARQSCIRELDIEAVLLTLRQEALARGLEPPRHESRKPNL